jgi:hypothetical protein
MQTVGGSPDGTPGFGPSAFLSSRPGEESQVVALFSQPQFRHVAFKVASLADLKRLYGLVLERELPIKLTADHGESLAFYFARTNGSRLSVRSMAGAVKGSPVEKEGERFLFSDPNEINNITAEHEIEIDRAIASVFVADASVVAFEPLDLSFRITAADGTESLALGLGMGPIVVVTRRGSMLRRQSN